MPHQEIAQQAFDRIRVLGPYRPFALRGDIAGETDNSVDQFAVAIERPFVAVGVEEIGDGREAFELFAVAAHEASRGCTNAHRL